jgi:hypothetical protein
MKAISVNLVRHSKSSLDKLLVIQAGMFQVFK